MEPQEFRRKRKAAGLTQAELAGLFGIGRRAIIEIEAGKTAIRERDRLALERLVQILAKPAEPQVPRTQTVEIESRQSRRGRREIV